MKFINQKNFLQIKYWIYGISILLIIRTLLNEERLFWDYNVVIAGVQAFVDGGNAYDLDRHFFGFVCEKWYFW